MERFDPRSNRWTPVASLGTRRKHLGVAVFNNSIYAVGGRDDVAELSSAERYIPQSNSWQPVVAMTSRRSGVSDVRSVGCVCGSPVASLTPACTTVQLLSSSTLCGRRPTPSWARLTVLHARRLTNGQCPGDAVVESLGHQISCLFLIMVASGFQFHSWSNSS